jgi:competence protein ComEC
MAKRNSSKKRNKKRASFKKILINALIVVALVAASWVLNSYYGFLPLGGGDVVYNKGEHDILVHFVDVGQGDCAIIQFPYGRNMIIDGGPNKSKNKVVDYIKSYGIKSFDYMVLTHPHEDHYGGLDDALTNSGADVIYLPDAGHVKTESYQEFLSAAKGSGAEIRYSVMGEVIEFDGGAEFVFFTPSTQDYIDAAEKSGYDLNNLSPIMILYYRDVSVVFTGDATDDTEQLFLSAAENHSELKDRDIQADVLKVAHHGSRDSSTEEFLEAVRPVISIISVGENNYGHPHPKAVERLKGCGEVLRTDIEKDIVIKITPQGIGAAIEILDDEKEGVSVKIYGQILMFIIFAHMKIYGV